MRTAALLVTLLAFGLAACADPGPSAAPQQAGARPSVRPKQRLRAGGEVRVPTSLALGAGARLVEVAQAGWGSAPPEVAGQRGGGSSSGRVSAGTAPVRGARVRLVDVAGQPVPGVAPTTTDESGRFELPELPGDGPYVVVAEVPLATGGAATLQTLLVPQEATTEVRIDPATTLVTTRLVAELAPGQLPSLAPEAFEAAVRATEAALATGTLPDFSNPVAVAERAEALADSTPAMREAIAALLQPPASLPGSAPAAPDGPGDQASGSLAPGGVAASGLPPGGLASSGPAPGSLPGVLPSGASLPVALGPASPGTLPSPGAPGTAAGTPAATASPPPGATAAAPPATPSAWPSVGPLGSWTVRTLVGSADGLADGPYATALLTLPWGVALAPGGALWVTDGNHRLRRLAEGRVDTPVGSTLPGDADGPWATARFDSLQGVATGPDGTVYVAEASPDGLRHRVRRVSPDGTVTTLAGGSRGFAEGRGALARFDTPHGLSVGSDGTVYVADTQNHRIRRIAPDGTVSTLAGSAIGDVDGTGEGARFNAPHGLTWAVDGHLYVADTANHRIRRISPAGVVTTVAGVDRGFADGQGEEALFKLPYAVAAGPDGAVYVADTANNRIRRVTPTGRVDTLAGADDLGQADGEGPAARFWWPTGLAVGPDGALVVVDHFNARVRRVARIGS
ncbi:MAG: hypothetical protein VKS61_00055 [Candidatus Sericytochromatia bacterium]|nr:hypothetical protein [Candidatus Sericytochromatia bacterium]